jgi:hypothetical protein
MPKSEKLKGRSSGPTTTSAARAEPGNESSSSPGGEAGSREARISEAAFFKAAARAFAPGHEWEDWFAAEQEIDAQSPGVVRKGEGIDTAGPALRPDPNSRIWSS